MSGPVPNSLPSFWRTNPHRLDTHRSTPSLPPTTDILIIGSGYSGAACAYFLTKDLSSSPASTSATTTPSITILEAREACSGATGRNGGHVKPDTYFGLVKYAQLYGSEASASIARFEADNLAAVKRLVKDESIDCDFHLTRAADVFIDDVGAADEAAANYAQLSKEQAESGVFDLGDVQAINDPGIAERVTGVIGALRAYTFTAAQLWPYKLVTALLELALARGNLNLQTNTPVSSISPTTDAGYSYSVQTPRGTILAKKVLVCTNAYTSSLLPDFKDKIIPCRGIAARIVTPDSPANATASASHQPPLLSSTYAIRGTKGLMDYLIHRPADHSIIVGGARSAFIRDLSSWYGNVDDSTLMSSAAEKYFNGYMQRHFHGWADSGAYVDKVWTGVMGYSADAVPFVGREKEGMYVMGGFTGHGMPQILGCARALVEELVMGMQMEEEEDEEYEKAGEEGDRRRTNQVNGSGTRVNGSSGPRLKGLASLPIPFRITEERMKSKMNIVLDGWGRTWDEKTRPHGA